MTTVKTYIGLDDIADLLNNTALHELFDENTKQYLNCLETRQRIIGTSVDNEEIAAKLTMVNDLVSEATAAREEIFSELLDYEEKHGDEADLSLFEDRMYETTNQFLEKLETLARTCGEIFGL